MVERVVVYGAGGMGREAAAWLRDASPRASLMGFVDDDRDAGGTVGGLPVLGGGDWLAANADVDVVVAVGAPQVRRRLADHVTSVGARLRTVIHPTAYVGPGTTIEPGCILCPGVVVSRDVRIGRCVIVNFQAGVGHDGVVGDHAFVGPGAHLAGDVVVEEGAEVGMGASVLQGRRIGAGARVGAGAVVTRDVDPGVVVTGTPARPRVTGRPRDGGV